MTLRESFEKPAPMALAVRAASAVGPFWLNAIRHALRDLARGQLLVRLPDGREVCIRGTAPGPLAEVAIERTRALRRLVLGGDIGFAEAYLDGDWTSPDLAAVFELAACNREVLGNRLDPWPGQRLLGRLAHVMKGNSRRGSRRNIAAHYDLGNDFYTAWLDPTMSYSAGIFAAGDDDLERAQERKYRRICHELKLAPGQHVLEIGCGWGGFAEIAASEFGARVSAITLSREQRTYTEARMVAAGLADRVDVRYLDYRDLEGQYDHIVSIEMVEAVGEQFWPGYFETLFRCLRPGGRAVLQSILIDAAYFEGYRQSPDFIQRYIFPGGMLPTRELLLEHAEAAGLVPAGELSFGTDYATTLAQWDRRFLDSWDEVRKLGFDERFRRLWHYYLAYCEGGFRGGVIDVAQFTLDRPV